MKKVTSILLAILMVMSFVATVSVSASAAEIDAKDGIQAGIFTDADAYAPEDEIKIEVKVKNGNSFDVDGVSVETVLPEGLIAKNSIMQSAVLDLAAGEIDSVSLVAVLAAEEEKPSLDDTTEAPGPVLPTDPTDPGTSEKPTGTIKPGKPEKPEKPGENSWENDGMNGCKPENPGKHPHTGDDYAVAIWATVFVIAAAVALFALKGNRKALKTMCLMLTCLMLFTMVPMGTFAVNDKAFAVEKTVTVDGEEYTISAVVGYDVVEEEAEIYTVTFETNGGSEVAAQEVEKGGLVELPETPEKEGYTFIGWYNTEDYTSVFDFTTPVVNDCVVYAAWINTSDETDTDADGLTDEIEKTVGSDPNKADTDGDGLNDRVEISVLYLDFDSVDTDSDGVSDADEDTDNDGISNIEEINKGLNPGNEDTDEDGLKDNDEISIYGTDPIKADTDEDGVSDGKEVDLGTNPIVPEEEFNVVITAEENEDSVVPSVDINLEGEQVETLTIESIEDDTFFPEEMPGYLGKAYDFNVVGNFEKAIISFEFDSSILDEGAVPTIYYFNEEEQSLTPLETTVENGVAKAEVTHFSKYILIDRVKYEESFVWIDTWDSEQTYTNAEIILVIDDSGSLGGDYGYDSSRGVFTGGTDPEHKRLAVARTFIDKSNDSAKIGIVKFDELVDDMTGGLVECTEEGKELLKNYLQFTYTDDDEDYNIHNIFDSRGYTNMYSGIDAALGQLTNSSEETLKVVVAFTDGNAHDTEMHDSVIEKANANNIKIYTVGLGVSSYYFDDYLKPLASETGGAFYAASNADQLAAIYENISQKIDINTDSDEDGLSDYYEENIVMFNGLTPELDKNNPDTDGDTLLDGEEIEVTIIKNADETKALVIGKYYSNPSKVDSDDDGVDDPDDKRPLKWDVSDRDLALVSKAVYWNLSSGTDLEKSGISIKTDGGELVGSVEELKKWKVVDSGYNPYTGMEMAAYSIHDNLIIAARGSESNDIADILQDWVLADVIGYLSGLNAQLPAMETFIKRVLKNEGSKHSKIYITGHSLGGYIAMMAASQCVEKGYESKLVKVDLFNGLGMSGISLIGKILDIDDEINLIKIRDKINNFRTTWDVVSKIGHRYGKTYTLRVSNSFAKINPITAHDLLTFVEEFANHNRKASYHNDGSGLNYKSKNYGGNGAGGGGGGGSR